METPNTKNIIIIVVLLCVVCYSCYSVLTGVYYMMSNTSTTPSTSTTPTTPDAYNIPDTLDTPNTPDASNVSGTYDKTFCEADYASNSITCPNSLKINSFKYWRPSNTSCVFPSDPSRVFSACNGQDYTSQAQALVNSNNLNFTTPVHTLPGFNDPCPNIYKQIDVNYTCT
jgi:hypothetical protein